MTERTAHLVERVAAQLRGTAGLTEAPASPAPAAPAPAAQPAKPPPAGGPAAQPLPPLPAPSMPTPSMPAAAVLAPPYGADQPPAADSTGDAAALTGAEAEIPDGVALDMAVLKRAGLALAGMRSRTTEEYRITVGRILRALHGGNRTTSGLPSQQMPSSSIPGQALASLVMVTSARPGEGKSFSTLNLSASIAQNGLADVLLVDVDGKPRSLTTLLGLRERQGLLDLVGNPALRPEDLVVRTAIPGFNVLPLGLNRSATAEGGVTRMVLGALERVRRRFPRHVVILDTAPCLSTSDPSTLAPLVDMTVMIVEAGRTQRSELGAALELVRACPNTILVLNKVRLTHRHSFGSYYYFGYPS